MKTSFSKSKHEYLIDGKRATGVTTIIGVLAKPQLIGWAAKMACEYIKDHGVKGETIVGWFVTPEVLESAKSAHQKKKEAAGEHGTSAHSLIETFVGVCLQDGGRPVLTELAGWKPEDWQTIYPFILWARENVDHFLFSERQMFNKELFIAGTADFAYVGKDGKSYMADFKTSSGIYGIDYWLQVAAYRMLAEAEGDVPYDGATVVRMGKDGSFEVQNRFTYEIDKEAFLACLTLYRAQATYQKVKN
jgi:hypothetical protein